MCVEGWQARSAPNLAKSSSDLSVLCMCRKLHLLENPQLVNPDCRDKHYFAKAILTRTSDSPGTTTTSLAIDSGSDPKGETECGLSG